MFAFGHWVLITHRLSRQTPRANHHNGLTRPLHGQATKTNTASDPLHHGSCDSPVGVQSPAWRQLSVSEPRLSRAGREGLKEAQSRPASLFSYGSCSRFRCRVVHLTHDSTSTPLDDDRAAVSSSLSNLLRDSRALTQLQPTSLLFLRTGRAALVYTARCCCVRLAGA